MISILIADDHRIVAEGLSLLLASQADFRVIGTAGDGVEAIRDRKSTRLNSSHIQKSRMPSSA